MKKMQFFSNMTLKLKKYTEDKELEKKKVKKTIIDKLGKQKKKLHQNEEYMKEIIMEKEHVAKGKDNLEFENKELKLHIDDMKGLKEKFLLDMKIQEEIIKSKNEELEKLEVEVENSKN